MGARWGKSADKSLQAEDEGPSSQAGNEGKENTSSSLQGGEEQDGEDDDDDDDDDEGDDDGKGTNADDFLLNAGETRSVNRTYAKLGQPSSAIDLKLFSWHCSLYVLLCSMVFNDVFQNHKT